MSRYTPATWRPIPENASQERIKPTQFLFHTQVGTASLYSFYRQVGVVVESHGWTHKDGHAEQYLDTTVRGDANYKANRRPDGTGAVSWEFAGQASEPFTPAQVKTAVKLLVEAHRRDGIPLRLCRTPDDPGVGWHVMWGAPGPWTPAVGKTCPGKTRISQIPAIIALARREVAPPKPTVRLSLLITAASHADSSYRHGTLIVQKALRREGLISRFYIPGRFGKGTRKGYAAWQRSKPGGGYRGDAANGVPGHDSLTRLGNKHGFVVR